MLAASAFAQDEIREAKNLIQNGQCAEAIAPLQKVYKSSFRKSSGERAAVMLTECYLREHKRDEALKLSSRFLEYYVNTIYRERMELANAIVLVEKGSVYEGVEAMLRILAYSKNPAARSRTKDVAIQTLAASLLTADQLQALLEKYPVDKDIVGWMQLQIGRLGVKLAENIPCFDLVSDLYIYRLNCPRNKRGHIYGIVGRHSSDIGSRDFQCSCRSRLRLNTGQLDFCLLCLLTAAGK